MKTFKALFDVSMFTQIPHTFVDSEMWIEFEIENIDLAEQEAFRVIVYELIENNHNVLKKVELLEIHELNGEELVQNRKYKDIEDNEY